MNIISEEGNERMQWPRKATQGRFIASPAADTRALAGGAADALMRIGPSALFTWSK